MSGIGYRSYLVRAWSCDEAEVDATRVRVEWIARGVEAEVRGRDAADLAARLADIFGLDAPDRDRVPGEVPVVTSKGGV